MSDRAVKLIEDALALLKARKTYRSAEPVPGACACKMHPTQPIVLELCAQCTKAEARGQ